MKTKNVEEFFEVERLSLIMILEKFLRFPKSEPCDSYELDSHKKSVYRFFLSHHHHRYSSFHLFLIKRVNTTQTA